MKRSPTDQEWTSRHHGKVTCEHGGERLPIFMRRMDWRNRFDMYVEDDCG